MSTRGALHEAVEAVTWYGKQAQLVATEVHAPITRTAHHKSEDPDPAPPETVVLPDARNAPGPEHSAQ